MAMTRINPVRVPADVAGAFGGPLSDGLATVGRAAAEQYELLWLAGGRLRLTANTTFFVRPDGNDANSGLTNDAAGAFLTLQGVFNYLRSRVDCNGYAVTIQMAAGTYASAVLEDISSAREILLIGDTANPSSVVVQAASFNAALELVYVRSRFRVIGVKLRAEHGYSLSARQSYFVSIGTTIDWEAVGPVILEKTAGTYNGFIYLYETEADADGTLTLLGNVRWAIRTWGSEAALYLYATITATLTVSDGFFFTEKSSFCYINKAITGAITGKKFWARDGGRIDGVTVTPGSLAGTVTSGFAVLDGVQTYPGGATLSGVSGNLHANGQKIVTETSSPSLAGLTVTGDKARIVTPKTPASATAAGSPGEVCWDTDFVYVCVGTNTWKRAALATW